MERNENIENAMLEVQHAIELAARIKEIRTELEDYIDTRLSEMESLSKSDHLTNKLDSADAALRACTLRSILRSFDCEYTCNSMNQDSKHHLDTLLRIMKNR